MGSFDAFYQMLILSFLCLLPCPSGAFSLQLLRPAGMSDLNDFAGEIEAVAKLYAQQVLQFFKSSFFGDSDFVSQGGHNANDEGTSRFH